MLPQQCRTLTVHRVYDPVPGSSVQGRRTVAKVCQMPDNAGLLRKPGTDLVCESVDGLWGWSRDLVIGECDNFFAT